MINFATRSFFIFFMTVGVVACTNPAVDITNRAMDAHDSSAYIQYLTDVVPPLRSPSTVLSIRRNR